MLTAPGTVDARGTFRSTAVLGGCHPRAFRRERRAGFRRLTALSADSDYLVV